MATILPTDLVSTSEVDLVETTLDGSSDTFTYDPDRSKYLVLRNPTGAGITPTIDGDGATTRHLSGVGDVDISGGYAVATIATTEAAVIPLAGIKEYLAGTITISSGTGLVASLLEF